MKQNFKRTFTEINGAFVYPEHFHDASRIHTEGNLIYVKCPVVGCDSEFQLAFKKTTCPKCKHTTATMGQINQPLTILIEWDDSFLFDLPLTVVKDLKKSA